MFISFNERVQSSVQFSPAFDNVVQQLNNVVQPDLNIEYRWFQNIRDKWYKFGKPNNEWMIKK